MFTNHSVFLNNFHEYFVPMSNSQWSFLTSVIPLVSYVVSSHNSTRNSLRISRERVQEDIDQTLPVQQPGNMFTLISQEVDSDPSC